MSDSLAGRSVLITGASTGIGRALALGCVERGMVVIAAARSADKLADLAAETGGAVVPVTADVSSDSSVRDLLAAVEQRLGAMVDVAVNNAGIGYLEPFALSDTEHWREIIETNLVGALRIMRAVLPPMLARSNGLIVNVGSNSTSGWPFLSLYSATKAALDAATTAIDRECIGTGVRVIYVDMGPTVGTEFGSRFSDADLLGRATETWTQLGIPWSEFVTPDVSARRILAALEQSLA